VSSVLEIGFDPAPAGGNDGQHRRASYRHIRRTCSRRSGWITPSVGAVNLADAKIELRLGELGKVPA